MRVLVDANPLVSQVHRGIGRTTRDLLLAMGEAVAPDDRLGYCLGAPDWEHPPEWRGLESVPLEPGEDLFTAADRSGIQVLHVMDYFHPLYEPADLRRLSRRGYRLVVTVRDLIPLMFPHLKRSGLHKLRTNLVPLVAVADQVIAISEYTRADILRFGLTDPERITVIYHGVDHGLFQPARSPEDLDRVLAHYGLEPGYIIYVSAFDPRKNHLLLINALAYLVRGGGLDARVVLVGPDRVPRFLSDTIRRLELTDRVRFLHGVPDSHLALLYAGAGVSAFTSTYEGFGNPVLEAMACGVPVVALARTSVREVADGAALLVEPDEFATFARAIAHVLTRPGLAERLRQRGLERAAEYTWARAARQMLEVYRSLEA